MIWWILPAMATLGAWLWTRRVARSSVAARCRPEPGSPEDLAELAQLADALGHRPPNRAG